MVSHKINKLTYFLSILTLTISAGSATAEDTEIYFNTGNSVPQPLRPNIMFILDSSASMRAGSGEPDVSRTQALKTAMRTILQDVEDVNVGLMRFNTYNGGPILFPITHIDAAASSVTSEPPDANPAFSYVITDGRNDAVESLTDNSMTLAAPTITVTETPAVVIGGGSGPTTTISKRVGASSDDADQFLGGVSLTQLFWIDGSGNTTDGVRFSGLNIPPNAKIEDAFVDFWVNDRRTSRTNTKITGHKVANSPAFSATNNEISTRIASASTRTATINWNGIARANNNSKVTTPKLTSIIQEIISQGCSKTAPNITDTDCAWSSGNALSLIFHSSSGGRKFHSYDSTNNNSRRPRLTVTYSTSSGASTTIPATNHIVGLRFPTLDIPKDAVITDARLTVTASTDKSGVTAWKVQAEDVGESLEFDSANSNLSNRLTNATTALTNWNLTAAATDGFASNKKYTSPNLKTVVQEVVNRADWCGGNPMSFLVTGTGERIIHSVEGSPVNAVKLDVSYKSGSGNGCFEKLETSQVGVTSDDAEEASDGSMTRFRTRLPIDSNRTLGLRFQGVDVPKNATITEAFIFFTADGTSTGKATKTIQGEDVDNSSTFTASSKNITNRTKTTASVTWTPPRDWATNGQTESTANLKTIVQEIVNRRGWASGNSMTFIITGSGSRIAESSDGEPASGPRLSIRYKANGDANRKTVRQRLIELTDNLPALDATPIVETLHEAARYWRGGKANFGKKRDDEDDRVSHPGSYCSAGGSCNGATVNGRNPTTDQFGVFTPSGCPTNNLDDFDCEKREIKGSPNYISPFTSTLTCQSNYQILLTDGDANYSGLASRTAIQNEFFSGAACRTTRLDGTTIPNTHELCGVDIAKFLAENDQSSLMNNKQLVKTYTIGFDTAALVNATRFLKDVAKGGGGEFREAKTADQLVTVFTSIIRDVKSDPTSFVAPSLATNAFNRLLSRDEAYFGLFTPSLNSRWDGNVKKYRVCTVTDPDGDGKANCTLGAILDVLGSPAINSTTNRFKSTAKSVWSDVADGLLTTKGGTGAELEDFTKRIIYTDTTSSGAAPARGTALNTAGFQFTNANWKVSALSKVRSIVCPTPSTDDNSDCEKRMLWILGKISEVNANTDTSNTTRWTVNDVLHSSPVVVTYGGEDDDNDGAVETAAGQDDNDGVISTFFDKLLVGTNDGSLRMINGTSGKEEWSFMPETGISIQRSLFDNPETAHTYGLDVTPVVRIVDHNSDGIIDPSIHFDTDGNNVNDAGDFIHAYIGMRRGGNKIYALDITPPIKIDSKADFDGNAVVPKFLWRIDGGTGAFARLGQTWSQPVLANVKVGGVKKPVLIFGGGYDLALDDATKYGTVATAGNDNLGNGIFIVDAATGSKILSISGTPGTDIVVPNMDFSIPSRVTVFDSNANGDDDRLYFGDTAGQVWRIDLGGNLDVKTPGTTVVGRLATVATASTASEQRRFFEPPSVVQVVDKNFSDAANGEFDYVLIGSGYRAHPLNRAVTDRFYGFRDKNLSAMTDGNGDNLADTYPKAKAAANSPIVHSDLVDVTTTALNSSNATHDAALGWYLNLTPSGQKVLSAPTTLAGKVFFTTFSPDTVASTDLCTTNIGSASAFGINILNAKGALDWDGDGDIDVADRKKALGGGIPSDVVPIFTKEGVIGIVGTEGGANTLGSLADLPRHQTYWYDE